MARLAEAGAALWIVVPAYNEGGAIGATLRGLADRLPRVVVVDDGSTDETARIAGAFGATVVRHAVNLGQGAALQTGIDYAFLQGATHVCTFDADGQHDAATIDVMLAALEDSGADVALGSRFLGETVAMPALRHLALRAAVVYTRWQTGRDFTDAHNGFRMLTRGAAEKLRIRQPGMAHASEILSAIARHDLNYVEVPTTVTYSAYSLAKGQSLANSIKILFDLVYAAWTR